MLRPALLASAEHRLLAPGMLSPVSAAENLSPKPASVLDRSTRQAVYPPSRALVIANNVPKIAIGAKITPITTPSRE
jgi:hypothetical protein